MATGRHLKTLFDAFNRRDESRFRMAAEAIIAEAEAKGHHRLARDLERSLGPKPLKPVMQSSAAGSQNDAANMVERIQPARCLDDLVLEPALKQQIQDIAADNTHADALLDHGVPPRRRLLFYGPPGCGKTSAAEALAHTLGWPLSILRLDAVIESFLGQTSANLRTVFEAIRWDQQVMLFDEFDALGRKRDEHHDIGEMKRIVSSLLMMLERFTGPGIMIAATNHDGLLDPALWRRFDDVAHFGLPDDEQTRKLLRCRLDGIHPGSGLSLENIAEQLQGLPHAAVEHAVWTARRAQLIAGDKHITECTMQAAVERTSERQW